jgi:hypothetical protein
MLRCLRRGPARAGLRESDRTRDSYRVCEGSYRIIYEIQDDALVAIVVKVGNRRDVHPGAVNSRIHLTSTLVMPLASGATIRRTGAGRARR